jgi:hypothetical protein
MACSGAIGALLPKLCSYRLHSFLKLGRHIQFVISFRTDKRVVFIDKPDRRVGRASRANQRGYPWLRVEAGSLGLLQNIFFVFLVVYHGRRLGQGYPGKQIIGDGAFYSESSAIRFPLGQWV